ncbi:MAG: hypothetical protein QM775_28475 [Pirellulales bacterium]
MTNSSLATYLNDHLSGSVLALELLEHLHQLPPEGELKGFLVKLENDIKADRVVLEVIMNSLQVAPSTPRKMIAWLTEKALQVKLWTDAKQDGGLKLLEAMEGITLGIEGKRLLWMALSAVKEAYPELQTFNFEQLAMRAVTQRQSVEGIRLNAAAKAFAKSQTIE